MQRMRHGGHPDRFKKIRVSLRCRLDNQSFQWKTIIVDTFKSLFLHHRIRQTIAIRRKDRTVVNPTQIMLILTWSLFLGTCQIKNHQYDIFISKNQIDVYPIHTHTYIYNSISYTYINSLILYRSYLCCATQRLLPPPCLFARRKTTARGTGTGQSHPSLIDQRAGNKRAAQG